MIKFFFVGGASGSGKTAIVTGLKNLFVDDMEVYDFDDIGVPEGADKKWRQEATEKWLQKILRNNKNTCLLGQIVLGEILACPSAQKIDAFNFYFLDVSDYERIQRLKKRNSYVDQNMLNWSSWLRIHHRDPQWTQNVIKDGAWDGLNFSVWDQLKSWDEKARVDFLNTTDYSIEEVTKKVSQWIKGITLLK